MNPKINLLQPYPFERLRALFDGSNGVSPAPTGKSRLPEIKLSIGEPQHETPALIKAAISANLEGLASYPSTLGVIGLREAIAAWVARRYAVPLPDVARQILPVNGSREALFSFAQAMIDPTQSNPLVVCPNPFYQIYEGAALLAGATPVYINTLAANDFELDLASIADSTWADTQLIYVCSPGNPTGKVMSLSTWQKLFELSDCFGFVIASDECYSEIYFEEGQPPLGALSAAAQLGRHDYKNLLMFSSLSKRSNVPGMRSGFVAGDAALLEKFLLYRTYHGSAMNPVVQAASIVAWNDEAHVIENRRLYAEKFAAVTPLVSSHLPCKLPDAGFYLWARTPMADTDFARDLYHQQNVVVLPGSYLAREHDGINPGAGFVRIALVPSLEDCLDAARRIQTFCSSL
ncbi:MAG: succinyldiaminopimelate transaminase [Rhodocyclaceae bacterium]|nr:succinyldiaminopimelate transaminase [Rhodocyclaceae bacterium]MBP6280106.1 succinyldiaminopimelate transaminase [Rhodocyclaceae bacterium]